MKIHNQIAKKIIESISYITIATVDNNGRPWNTPVFAAYNDEYNFYWGSHTESQHSMNVVTNPKVFIVIFDSSAATSEGEGVYMQAEVSEVMNQAEINQAYNLLVARDPNFGSYWQLSDFKSNGPVRIYKAVPLKTWKNDADKIDGIYIDVRRQIS